MRNPSKKFQNSSIHGSKVMLCIKKRDERTDGRTTQKQYAPPTSLKLGEHNKNIPPLHLPAARIAGLAQL